MCTWTISSQDVRCQVRQNLKYSKNINFFLLRDTKGKPTLILSFSMTNTARQVGLILHNLVRGCLDAWGFVSCHWQCRLCVHSESFLISLSNEAGPASQNRLPYKRYQMEIPFLFYLPVSTRSLRIIFKFRFWNLLKDTSLMLGLGWQNHTMFLTKYLGNIIVGMTVFVFTSDKDLCDTSFYRYWDVVVGRW